MTETPASRPRKGARVFAGVSLALVVTWLGANGYPYDPPPPQWSEADLPSMPAESDNGWPVAMEGEFELDIPATLEELIDPSEHEGEGEIFWLAAEAKADALHTFLATNEARAAGARIDAARLRPAFAATCAIGSRCPLLDWRELHELATLRAVELTLIGDIASSCALLRDLIRLDQAHLASAPSLIAFLVALADLNEALDQANMVALRVEQGGATSDASAALSELAEQVRAVDPGAIDLRVTIIGEYLSTVQMLDTLDDGEAASDLRIDLPPLWFYSRALTLRSINASFERRYEAAARKDTSASFGDGASPRQQLGWWLRNPVGKIVIDAMAFDATSLATSTDEKLARVGQTRAAFLARKAVLAATR